MALFLDNYDIFLIRTISSDHRFSMRLKDKTYFFEFRWIASLDDGAGWMMSIWIDEPRMPLANHIPLVSNVNLIAQLGYLEIADLMFIDNDLPPDINTLGNGVNLYAGLKK